MEEVYSNSSANIPAEKEQGLLPLSLSYCHMHALHWFCYTLEPLLI